MASIIINCRYSTSITIIKRGGNLNKIGGNGHKFYYTISGEHNGLDFSKLRNILSEYNFHPKPISASVHVSFGTFITDGKNYTYGQYRDNYDPLFIKQHAAIKNVLNGHNVICDKTLFYKTIKSLIPMGYKYIPPTYSVEEFDSNSGNIDSNSVYILKKKNTAQGKGVLVFSTMSEYLEAKKELNIHKDGIVSKYITNPLTVDGKKMHLRVYILVTIQSGITRCYIHDKYKIYNAEEVYIQEDWLNPKIHISGPNSIPKQYTWPDDVSKSSNVSNVSNGGNNVAFPSEELLNNMNECFAALCQCMALSKLSHYEESYSGYHLYGVDILLTDDNKVYILEINKRPGFSWVKDSLDKNFSHNLFSFILRCAVFPFLGIKRLQNPIVEVCTNGQLLPFAKLLTGLNRNILIPIGDATQDEISSSILQLGKINCITKKIPNTYLISQNSRIIGYLALSNSNYINIFIIKEFQGYKIDDAMIGLLMEIQAYINYPHRQKSIKYTLYAPLRNILN
jgi:hypothetical protein